MFITESKEMKEIMKYSDIAATVDANVFITGEQGTGKDHLAQYIHEKSSRNTGPFITLDISGRPLSIVDSEILGHDRGAFTGASKEKSGFLLSAHSGTLFLKNLEHIPYEKQSLLIQFVEKKTVTPIGSSRTQAVDTRIIASCSSNIDDLIKESKIRLDLYYRLSSLHIRVPSLKERSEDILPLANYFLAENARIYGSKEKQILSKDAISALLDYDWPGNVRELKNIIERAVIQNPKMNKLTSKSLDINITKNNVSTISKNDTLQELNKLKTLLNKSQQKLYYYQKSALIANPIWQGRNFKKEEKLTKCEQ